MTNSFQFNEAHETSATFLALGEKSHYGMGGGGGVAFGKKLRSPPFEDEKKQ